MQRKIKEKETKGEREHSMLLVATLSYFESLLGYTRSIRSFPWILRLSHLDFERESTWIKVRKQEIKKRNSWETKKKAGKSTIVGEHCR